MAGTLYGLLVGINDYLGGVRPLRGCLNDIQYLQQFLQRRCKEPAAAMKLRVLPNEKATRAAVVAGFREHLRHAGPDDVVLFAFSGHGSQEAAPKEFWDADPSHKNQTIVCHDSRAGTWDLADKELSLLLSEVAAAGCRNIVVLLDCCHAGSGTRGEERYRLIEPSAVVRPVESYLFGPGRAPLSRPGTSAEGTGTGGYQWACADHVLLAACEPRQLAAEYQGAGEHRGAFSYFLGDALERTGGLVTYRDLMARTRALLSSFLYDQTPQVEAGSQELLDRPFLGTTLADVPRTLIVALDEKRGQWFVNAGELHGIKMVSSEETTTLALFSASGPGVSNIDLAAAIGRARVTQVQPAESVVQLNLSDGSASASLFRALVLESPQERLPVRLLGEEAGVEPIRQGLLPREGQIPARYVREAGAAETPRLVLHAEKGQYLIRRPEDQRLLVQPLTGYAESAALAVRQLEQIAHWYLTVDLMNDPGELDGTFEILVEINGKPSPGPDHRLEYRFDQGKWQQPTFRLGVHNQSARSLYCSLVTLSDDWSISTSLFNEGVVLTPPRSKAWANNGEPLFGSVPRDLWKEGVTEFSDRVLAIVSDRTFDARPLEQQALGRPRNAYRGGANLRKSTLQHLLLQTGTRAAWSTEPEELDQWQTARTSFTVVRPLESVEVPAAGAPPRRLLGAMQVAGHPAFRGRVQLLTPGQAGDLAPPPFLPTDDPQAVVPFHPTLTRGGGPEAHFLEIKPEDDAPAVSPDAPLRFPLGSSLASDEKLLAIAHDGEFWLPVGVSERGAAGEQELVIRSLPKPTRYGPVTNRSVTGAYGAYVYKIAGKAFGRAPKTVRLARAVWGPLGSFDYDDNPASLRKATQAAQRILLMIHGIYGATDTMLPCLRTGKPFADGKALSESYDLVLAFDYENLNTPISETARALKATLAEIGLGPDHGKRVDLVAHSMGGLVARWFIEQEEGNAVISRLVMLGTPSGGSPWPTVHSLATLGVTAVINAVSAVPAHIYQALTGALGGPDVTLGEMTAGSTFLGNLLALRDPKVPYGLVVGNLSLSSGGDASWWKRAWDHLSAARLVRDAANLAVFWGKPNDIAVTVESMKNIPPGRRHVPLVRELNCDHLRYFEDFASLRALAELLR